jgi:Rad3-related DNA helicase
MEFDLNKIPEHFPFDTFREGQRECIEKILKAFASGKKYVVLEGPVGSGKSAVGIAVARFFQRSYYLTVQKILQTQLMNDFGSRAVMDLKGRSAYDCNFYENFGLNAVKRKGMTQREYDKFIDNPPSCDNGYCRRKEKARKSELCFPNGPYAFIDSTCPYYHQIGMAMAADMCIMNYSSFLYQTNMSGRFGARDLLVIDEAHQSEPQLLDFISVLIDDKRLQRFGFKLEEYDLPEEYWAAFIQNDILSKVREIAGQAEADEDFEIADEYDRLARRLSAFYESMESGEEWVAEFRAVEHHRTVTLKPVFVVDKSHKLLFNRAERVLLMSATILEVDIFCSSLGIPRSQVDAIRMKNRFPVENRPIYVHSAGKIAGGPAKMHEWAPNLVAKADEILDKYQHDRGIIHTHNFAIADLMMNKSRHRTRFLYQKNFKTKEAMLDMHSRSDNSVIVAPAMHEGLDLYGDLSRIQLICKVPWPNFKDNKQLTRRMELDRRYYLWITALKLIQSSGRSIRSDTDWAHTYVLDEVFYSFMQQAASMIPKWFKDAIEFGELNESTYISVKRPLVKVPEQPIERILNLD